MASQKLRLTDEEISQAFQGHWAERCPPIISPKQLAELIGRSRKTIDFWIAQGRFDGAYRKRGKHCLFWRDRAIKVLMDGKDWS